MADELQDLMESWRTSLEARNRAANTIDSYLLAVRRFGEWLDEAGRSGDANSITRRDVDGFIAHELATWKPTTALVRFKSLQQFFAWLVGEDEIAVNPMADMVAPFVPDAPVPVVSDDWLGKLLGTCSANTFVDRRDMAILRLFIATPCRRAEIAHLGVGDVDVPGRRLHIVRKGRRPGVVPFGAQAAQALDRYLRVRRRHRWSDLPQLWIAQKGPMTASGLAQVLERRCQMAEIPKLHLHQFRHTFAHEWLSGGGSEGNLMTLAGWSSRAMLKRYGSMLADERAHEAYRQRSPGDRL